jgi:hypothetical protein
MEGWEGFPAVLNVKLRIVIRSDHSSSGDINLHMGFLTIPTSEYKVLASAPPLPSIHLETFSNKNVARPWFRFFESVITVATQYPCSSLTPSTSRIRRSLCIVLQLASTWLGSFSGVRHQNRHPVSLVSSCSLRKASFRCF